MCAENDPEKVQPAECSILLSSGIVEDVSVKPDGNWFDQVAYSNQPLISRVRFKANQVLGMSVN
jgi:hypothetical protein